ncbi:hypothetical protein Noda2021_03650 [Candidatus Dependentiae bacterium Noda2021]|nr:hypothetical protein Noda2021_03650 [Candidatus Dependentiae bacterium Noda2021]
MKFALLVLVVGGFFNVCSMEHRIEMVAKPQPFKNAASIGLDTQEPHIIECMPYHKYQNNNQNWFDPGIDVKRIRGYYKEAQLLLEEKIITRYGYDVENYTLEGPNP